MWGRTLWLSVLHVDFWDAGFGVRVGLWQSGLWPLPGVSSSPFFEHVDNLGAYSIPFGDRVFSSHLISSTIVQ